MTLQLYNTLTRRKEPFQPADPQNVRMYVCGPTVYQRIHIGNARPLIVFDVLFRLLRHLYGEQHVTYVRNITDIDDKIIDQAKKNGEPIEALTERTTRDLHADIAALGCLPPTHEPRATQHVPGMIALIEKLIGQGHAYAAEGHVLFSVPSMPAYGRLSGRNRDDQIAGARVDVAPYKRDPADFVLWKPSPPDLPGWDSPWGRGRPGWHIECSAMSEALLSPLPFDIHGGGLDLIFPHHENEIAQTCCAHGLERMANIWMHNGFVEMRGEKMAKSVGNVLRMDEALKIVPGEVLRWWMLSTHYRQPIDCNESALLEARTALTRFYSALDRKGLLDGWSEADPDPDPDVVAPLLDDLNGPLAIARMYELLSDFNTATAGSDVLELGLRLRSSGHVLGILERRPQAFLRPEYTLAIVDGGTTAPISHLQLVGKIAQREHARRTRDFDTADRIRAELQQRGIILEDRSDGTTDWRRA